MAITATIAITIAQARSTAMIAISCRCELPANLTEPWRRFRANSGMHLVAIPFTLCVQYLTTPPRLLLRLALNQLYEATKNNNWQDF